MKSRCARGRARLAVLLGHLRPAAVGKPSARPGTAAPITGVPGVTPGNPGPVEGVGSRSGRYRRDANQEDT